MLRPLKIGFKASSIIAASLFVAACFGPSSYQQDRDRFEQHRIEFSKLTVEIAQCGRLPAGDVMIPGGNGYCTVGGVRLMSQISNGLKAVGVYGAGMGTIGSQYSKIANPPVGIIFDTGSTGFGPGDCDTASSIIYFFRSQCAPDRDFRPLEGAVGH